MPLLVGAIAFFFPRLVIVGLVIATDYIGRAYETTLWPLLGFLFAPLTTLAYALAINQGGGVQGLYLIILVVAALCDVGIVGRKAMKRRK
ncbi:MAG: hypothetical protein ACKVS8_10555 [Phycisphaerales bacterium]